MVEWEKQHPARGKQVFASLTNTASSQLTDAGLFDLAGPGGAAVPAMDWLKPEPGVALPRPT